MNSNIYLFLLEQTLENFFENYIANTTINFVFCKCNNIKFMVAVSKIQKSYNEMIEINAL